MKKREDIEEEMLLPDIQRSILLDIRQILANIYVLQATRKYDPDFLLDMENLTSVQSNEVIKK
jgi:hypothetical protein